MKEFEMKDLTGQNKNNSEGLSQKALIPKIDAIRNQAYLVRLPNELFNKIIMHLDINSLVDWREFTLNIVNDSSKARLM